MVGGTDWNQKKYEVIQRGSKSWTGTIIVWKDIGNGRRESGAVAGDWAQGDRIQLKACAEAGISLLLLLLA